MEVILFQIIFFIALILLSGLFGWREYVNSCRAHLLHKKVAAQKRCLDSMKESLALQSKYLESVSSAYGTLKEYTEGSRQFAEKAEISLDKLNREFEIVMSYRKENLRHFDGVEGI